MKQQAEKAKTLKDSETGRKKRRKTSPIGWVLFLVLSGVSAYIWIASPDWLKSGPAPVPPTLADAGLRMEVYQQAILVNAFLEASGHLPSDLAEAGVSHSNVTYTPLADGRYTLRLNGPTGSVEYDSAEPLEEFLGNALQVIRQGG